MSKTKVILLGSFLIVVGYFTFQKWQGPVVQVHLMQSAPLVQTVVASGRVMNQARLHVGTEVAGMIVTRHVTEGDRVEAGDVLFELRAETIDAQLRQVQTALNELSSKQRPQAEVELERATIELTQSERESKRRLELWQANLLAEEAYEQAQRLERLARINHTNAQLQLAALAVGGTEEQRLQAELAQLQAQRDKTIIRAPSAGVILTRFVETGDIAQPGQTLLTVALDGVLEVRAQLDERNLGQLALQQSAVIIADAYPEKPFPASLTFIAPAVDPERGTIEVRLQVSDESDFLRQDLTVSVSIETARRSATLVIPNEALQHNTGARAQVLVVRDRQTEWQTVELGLRGLTQTEILRGLEPGDQVIMTALNELEAGQRIRVQSSR
ncbi:efflux RND transporter periplasmic adaptor subunit [Aliidiomarina haloalkalitolerans]|uniref:Efflux RND transporter periplasmic adaptor subunit n=1 Tax=Aliidiomarina haloalkalitolerans TaxID=859059 RepID=A0A432VVQ3_9GAMM|nr:efflux RND transporter periplasmic adaptor subunit [Aliidiomarina haloalkalitolerans]RUO20677.1 efflux RND transporter periplasmic adaptor subunit [Aliidiomarina haloalkalitolerans]